MSKPKVLQYEEEVYDWEFIISSKQPFSGPEKEDFVLLDNDLISIANNILSQAEGIFKTNCFTCGYDKVCEVDNLEELISCLKKYVKKKQETNPLFSLRQIHATGKLLLSVKNDFGEKEDLWISKDSDMYGNHWNPNIKQDSILGEPIKIRFFSELKNKVGYVHVSIITYTDAWFDTTIYKKYNGFIPEINKETAKINRKRLLKFLHNIKNQFPDAEINEYQGGYALPSESQITLLKD